MQLVASILDELGPVFFGLSLPDRCGEGNREGSERLTIACEDRHCDAAYVRSRFAVFSGISPFAGYGQLSE